MDNDKALLGIGVAIAAVILLSRRAQAATTYTCPYGDGLTFASLAALNAHIADAHPGMRQLISITWST
jgi:hypothetical protein